MLTRNLAIPLFSLFIIAFIVGCSNDSSPLSPEMQDGSNFTNESPGELTRTTSNRNLWGLWEIKIEAATGDYEITPLRTAEWHVNAIQFIEAGGHSTIQLRDVIVDGSLVDVNVGLTHPFPGLYQWSGFDARGIFIGDGSFNDFISDGDLCMADVDEPRLYNADGWTRWWNPMEFPIPNVLGYKDGVFGVRDSQVKYRTNLNGYKYFSDDLGQNGDFPQDLDLDQRGLFKATSSVNWRHYSIDFGSSSNWYVFNYAVDASHQFKPGYDGSTIPPLSQLPDPFFDREANMPEPFAIVVEPVFNSLYYANPTENGGDLVLQLDIYDWQALDNPDGVAGEIEEVLVESPSLIGPDILSFPVPPGPADIKGTVIADLTSCHPDGNTGQFVLITVKSTSGSYNFGYDGYETNFRGSNDQVCSYYVYTPFVDTEVPPQSEFITLTSPNGGEIWVSGTTENIQWVTSSGIDFVKVEYSDDGGTNWYTIDGGTGIMPSNASPYAWDIPQSLASPNMLVKVSDASPEMLAEDQSDGLFAIESLTLDYPDVAGDDFEIGKTGQYIQWTIGSGTTSVINNIYIEFSKDSGSNWQFLNSGSPVPAGPGQWEWIPVLGNKTDFGRIRITDADHSFLTDESSEDFKVFEKHQLEFSEYKDYYQSGPYTYRGKYNSSLSGINSYLSPSVTSWDFTVSPLSGLIGTGTFSIQTAGGNTIPRIAGALSWTSNDLGMRPSINGTATRRPWWVFRFNNNGVSVHPRGSTYYIDATFTDLTFPGFCIDYIACDMTEQFTPTSNNDFTFPIDDTNVGDTTSLSANGTMYWVNHGISCNAFNDTWDVNMNSSEFEVVSAGQVKTPAGTFDNCLLLKLRMTIGPQAQIVHTGQLLYQWVNMDGGAVVAFIQTHNEGNSTAGIPYTYGFTGDNVNRGLIGALN